MKVEFKNLSNFVKVDFKNLRVPADYPTYPPYHKGDYMEEYFYKYYIENKSEFDKTGFTLIPIFWTNVYLTSKNKELLQPYLNYLPKDKKYFTVSQHDDAVNEILPPGTLRNGIPLPLICSPLERDLSYPLYLPAPTESRIWTDTTPRNKDIFCSFVGSISNNAHGRVKLYQTYSGDPDFYFSKPRYWTAKVPDSSFKEFIDISQRSEFCLAPRGYGKNSFRFYEVMQLGSIPVFVYDEEWLPFKKYIDWSEFCVLVEEKDIPTLKDKLKSYTKEQKEKMLKKGKEIYENYFTMHGFSKTILRHLQDEK